MQRYEIKGTLYSAKICFSHKKNQDVYHLCHVIALTKTCAIGM